MPPAWAIVLAGPLIGTVYFWLLYLLAEEWLRRGLELVGETVLRLVVSWPRVWPCSAALLTAFAWRARLRRALRRRRAPTRLGALHGDDGLMLLVAVPAVRRLPGASGDRDVAVLIQHGGPVEPADAWTAWNWDPSCGWSSCCRPRLRRLSARPRRRPARWRRRPFLAALLRWPSPASPLDAWAHRSVAPHGPAPAAHDRRRLRSWCCALPGAGPRRPAPGAAAYPVSRTTSVGRGGRAGPSGCARVDRRVACGWHAAPCTRRRSTTVVHALEHWRSDRDALLSWAGSPGRQRRSPAARRRCSYCSVATASGGLLGLLLTSPRRRVPLAETTELGPDPLEDQQLAGVIMGSPEAARTSSPPSSSLLSGLRPRSSLTPGQG